MWNLRIIDSLPETRYSTVTAKKKNSPMTLLEQIIRSDFGTADIVHSDAVNLRIWCIKKLDDFKIHDPYRNVPFMDSGAKKDYTSVVNQYVSAGLGKYNVITGTVKNSGNYTKVEDNLISKKIKVNIESSYKMPVDSVAEMFGKKGPFDVNTTMVSAVVDSPDFVRNVDLTMDVVKQTKLYGNMENGYNKIRDALDKVKELLK